MASGDEYKGVDGVRGMLHFVYHVAFEAKAEARNLVIADGKAVLGQISWAGSSLAWGLTPFTRAGRP